MNLFWHISHLLIGGSMLFSSPALGQIKTHNRASVMEKIAMHKFELGAKVPANLADRLGATHVGGKYALTQKPYLIEGCEQLYELGFRVCKLWFYKKQSGYPYHSNWQLPESYSLQELATHPYYKAAFEIPFSTIILSTSAGQVNDKLPYDSVGLINEEQEYYQLTKYLLNTYKDRKLQFILENWEGDWIVRGGTSRDAQWGRVQPPTDWKFRMQKLQRLFKARQDGVNRARAEMANSQCRVYHAIEINKVIDALYQVPTLVNDVLPFVEIDMVSWSAYDATDFDKTGYDLYVGIDHIRSKMRTTPYMKGKKVVFLGEIGIPEMSTKQQPAEFKERWDNYLAVCMAQDIPYIIHWELYCNETAPGITIQAPNQATKETELNGFWLIKPDGTKGYAMQYFESILSKSKH
jgi:hypothetical protein